MEFTALIPAAGLGTRMLPATKETPKEMLPVPVRSGSSIVFKPFIQVIFEHLYGAGIRSFVFVVGRGKRILQDHFLPDYDLLEELEQKGKEEQASTLREFHRMLEDSTIIWVDQHEPRGLGDAVKRGLQAVSTEGVLVHLGDILLYGRDNFLSEFLSVYKEAPSCSALLGLFRVKDPRKYGVVVPGEEIRRNLYRLVGMVEKPENPPSDMIITGVYAFRTRDIREALESTGKNPRTGEIEITDAIARLVEGGGVCGYVAEAYDYIDIGKPETYIETLFRLVQD